MNTYNENLQNTVINTLAGIYQEQQNLDSEQIAAQYTLYLAQGTEITQRDKLTTTGLEVTNWESINNQASINDNQMYNLLNSTNNASKIVATSITNVATAASNVQIASNAISLLSSDIGAALNIATASLFNTDAYTRILQANTFINDVANEANSIAKDAMNASASTSEVISTEVLTLAKGCKTKVGGVLNSTQSELNKFAKLYLSDWQGVSNASKLERQAEGALDDAERALRAIKHSYNNANSQLNMGLTIEVISGFEITADFLPLPSPLPTFSASPASDIVIPAASPKYYLTLMQLEKAGSFSIDQAMQLFQQSIGAGGAESGFLTVLPQSGDGQISSSILLSVDALGNQIIAGGSYVAYIFTELELAYKQYINNFSDLLSAPSQPFVPATTLPGVQNVVLTNDSQPDSAGIFWSSMQFQGVPLALSPEQAAQAAAADAEQASLTNAAANLAVSAAINASTTIGGTSTAAAAETQRAQTLAVTAANDAQLQAKATSASQIAAVAAETANIVAVATNATAVAASVANTTATAANTAWQNLSSAQTNVDQGNSGSSTTDISNKGKGKGISTAGAQTAAPSLSEATASLLPAVSAVEVAANYAAIAANAAAVLVTLYDPINSPRCDPDVLNLAIAQTVANAANAAASSAATAAATAANDAANAAAATAKGSSSASAANNAATTASSAAQVSDTAATTAIQAQAAVTAASVNLTVVQIQQANKVLIDAAAIVAAPQLAPASQAVTPAAIPPIGLVASRVNALSSAQAITSTSAPSISPEISSAILSTANSATSALAEAKNAVTVTNDVNSSFSATTDTSDSDGIHNASNSVQTAISTVVKSLQSLSTQATTNANSSATVATRANQQAVTAATNAKNSASQAGSSATAAAAAAQVAATANDAAAAAISQADVTAKAAKLASEQANAAAAAAQASATLACTIAAAGKVSEGVIMAADAIAGANYEYRCILVRVNDQHNLNLKLAEENQYTPPIYFNLNIAQQVAPANYVVAHQQGMSSQSGNSKPEAFSNPVWEIVFDSSVTDNYGDLLIPGQSYFPYFLTIVNSDQTEQSAFINTLNRQAQCVICSKPDNSVISN